MQKIISLCIPTNGVSKWVFPVLDSIYSQGISEEEFEIVVSDNGNDVEFENNMIMLTKPSIFVQEM